MKTNGLKAVAGAWDINRQARGLQGPTAVVATDFERALLQRAP